ncbi:MAG: peptide chain release factor 1 [Acidobacteria bacterium]|jgi:peptide chain release factor subunit 1|nr:MAG: peptide chain release factor 1 [Acidobacteriota bacterium]
MTELRKRLEKLLSFEIDDYLVSNLYLRLDAEARVDRKYLRTFKDMVKEQKEVLRERGLKKEIMESVERDFQSMEEFLSEPENLKGFRGIALFSSHGKGLFEVVGLPYVYRNRLMLSVNPLIREIASIDEELGIIGILLIDRKHVRFFLMNLEGIYEVVDFVEPLATRAHKFHSGGDMLKGAQGTMKFSIPARVGGPNLVQHSFGEYRFHMRIQEEKHRLFKIANDALMEALKEHKFDWLVIGSDREDIGDIESHLHTYLKQRLKGYIRVNPSYVPTLELREKVFDLLIEKDREEEEELVKELFELEGVGLAVNGTSKVLEQLHRGNVKVLLVPENFEKPGYICARSHLPLLEPQCPSDEPVYPVPDVVDEIIEFAMEERARVKTVVSPELQKKIDGLACLTRFAL